MSDSDGKILSVRTAKLTVFIGKLGIVSQEPAFILRESKKSICQRILLCRQTTNNRTMSKNARQATIADATTFSADAHAGITDADMLSN